jgi:prephenate dehydrogenase
MWRDIALMNRDGILEMMDFFSKYFMQLRSLLESADSTGLEDFFIKSKQSRDSIL